MNSFATFLESDALFPVLIILLIILIGVFVFTIVSGKKQEKILKAQRDKVISGGDEIKIVKEPNENIVESIDSEENIIMSSSLEDDLKYKKVTEDTVIFDPIVISEEDENIIDNSFSNEFSNIEDETDVNMIDNNIYNDFSNIENEEDELPKEKTVSKYEEENESLDKEKVIDENESIDGLEIVRQEEKQDELLDNINEEEKEVKDLSNSPFEYTSEKTEVFDFPDFSDIVSNGKELENAKLSDLKENIDGVSEDVIKEANKYIEEIMKNEESRI